MAFLGSLLGGLAGAAATVAPIISTVSTVGTLFRGGGGGAPEPSGDITFRSRLPSSPYYSPFLLRRHWALPTRMSLAGVGIEVGDPTRVMMSKQPWLR